MQNVIEVFQSFDVITFLSLLKKNPYNARLLQHFRSPQFEFPTQLSWQSMLTTSLHQPYNWYKIIIKMDAVNLEFHLG